MKIFGKRSKQTSPSFWEQIETEYPNHWVLIGNPKYDPDKFDPQGGELLFATDKKDDLVVECRKLKSGSHCAVLYTGPIANRLFLYTS